MIRMFAWLLLCVPAFGAAQETSPIPAEKIVAEDRLDDVLQHVDPSLEGWNTEVLSDQAQALISGLAEAGLAREALPGFVAQDVMSSVLRPASLTVLRESKLLNVARGTISSEMRPGRAALGQAFSDLSAFHGKDLGRLHVKMKIVRVVLQDTGSAITQGLFRVWNRNGSGVTQSDNILTCEWRREAGELVMTSLRAEAHTQSSSSYELFADCSAAVLGGNAAWSEQLLRGTDDWCGTIERNAGMNQYAHTGLTIGDFNSDGLEDLYVNQAGGLPNRLFIQNADGTATDRSAEMGLDWLDDSRAALFSDFDGDGQNELVLTLISGLVIMAREDSGRYEVKTVLPIAGGYSLAAADYDGDGWVDLYVCNYATAETKSGLPAPYHDANNGPPNNMFRNLGGLKFEDVTSQVGLDENNMRFSFAASWADYDYDGDQDLYVSNDFGRNSLYKNTGGKFEDVAAAAGVEDISAGMGVAWGDYDGDGLVDIYVSNMFSSAGQRIAYQRRFKNQADESTREDFQRHARGNSLFRNLGNGTFEDVTVAANTWMGRWSWGADFTDFDNDGRQDLFVPNGFITNEQTKDL
ncbi:MAG: hypothetical protein ACI8X5_001086 [Planctomycetota bacterium]|jgi:hypothetical protein